MPSASRRRSSRRSAIGPGSRVADVGAGSGLLTVHLARAVAPNGKVVATDIDGAVLDLLKQRLAGGGPRATSSSAASSPPTRPGSRRAGIDAILLAEVDHYFPRSRALARDGGQGAQAGRPDRDLEPDLSPRPSRWTLRARPGSCSNQRSTPVPTHFIAVFVVPGAKK